MSSLIRVNTLPGRDIRIEPAPVQRRWMDATPERYAYRCLPLNIANAHGWQILNTSRFRACWDGTKGLNGLDFEVEDLRDPPVTSHFGSGIVTFHIPAVITTPPGISLFATGPVNAAKAGITPLTGIVETDWLPFTFTMNWRMQVKGHWIEFAENEPICMIFPVRLDDIEAYDIEVAPIENDADLLERHKSYANSRAEFLQRQKSNDPEAIKARWQKHYFQGRDGNEKQDHHRTVLKLSKPRKA